MNKNLKFVFLLTTLIFLLVSVSAISAENTTGKDITDKATTVTAEKSVDTQKVVNTNKNIVKTEKVNKTTKAETNTHIVTQDNVDEIFSGGNYTLSDSISEGDTLDFQGNIDKNHSLVINKPITVYSSTKDAIISLHTVAGSLMGEDPGNSFVINKGASGSYISELYLDNTECWVHNLYNATLYNMTMHVQNARVGSGVGQTSIRYANNITLDKCYIYTENNGGSSSFVWTGCNYCTIQNSVVETRGQVGNLLYVGNVFNPNDKPADYVLTSNGNRVINCTIRGGTGGTSNPLQIGGNDSLIQGNKFYSNGTVGAQALSTTLVNTTYIDNEIYDKAAFNLLNATASGNVIYGTGKVSINANCNVYNNTFKDVDIKGVNATFESNTVNGLLTLNIPTNIVSNNLYTVSIASNGKNSNITDNNITGKITSEGANVTISKNEIITNTEYAVESKGAENVITNNTIYSSSKTGDAAVTATNTSIVADNLPKMPEDSIIVTDDTYSQFFDENGYAIVEKIPNYGTVVLTGTFNNKVFKFKENVVIINSNNAVLNNGVIISEGTAGTIIDGVKIDNTKEIENAVIFNSSNNIIRNSKITKTTNNESNAREILVIGDNNLVENVIIEISGNSHPIDYDLFPNLSPIIGILVTGSSNTIKNNTVTFNELGGVKGSTDLITISGAEGEAKNNKVTNNILNALNVDGYLYAINLGVNANYNHVTYNNISINSSFYAYGVQILECPLYGNNVSNNNIRVNATETAYGVFANVWSWDSSAKFGNMLVNYNKIYVNAENAFAIQLTGNKYGDTVLDNLNITYNNFYVNGTYAMGVGLYKTNNVYLFRNTYTIAGLESEPNPDSKDYVQARTAGIYVEDANYTEIATEQGNNVTNGPNVIIYNSTIGTIRSGLAYISNMNNIILENSELFNITSTIINSTEEYGIELINSNSNKISSNTLNTASEFGGNNRILVDEYSENNTITTNKPVSGELTFITETAKLNDNLNITVNVKTSDNKVVKNGTVIFTDELGTEIGTVEITDGVATFEYGTVSTIDDIVIHAQYLGNSTLIKSAVVEQVIEVYAESEVLPLEEDITVGDETTITAVFYDEYNQPVTSGKAIFRVNGKTLRNDDGTVIYVNVDEEGKAYFDVDITTEWLKPDTTIEAIYIGNDNTPPITTLERVVNVEKPEADVELTVPETAKAGDKITLEASITDDNGMVTSGRVAFKFNGKTIKDESGKAQYIDVENGFARVEYTIPAKTKASTTYVISAVFTDSAYERSQDDEDIAITK